MPNGGRKGDNAESWWYDDLCAGRKTFCGPPIDDLLCELYRLTNDEHGVTTVGPKCDPATIDRVALEQELHARIAREKEHRADES